jgi:hypothetical protein
MAIQPKHFAKHAVLPLFLICAVPACAGSHAQSKPPSTAAASEDARASSAPATPEASAPATQPKPHSAQSNGTHAAPSDSQTPGDADDAELVVSRDVVAACPTLVLVRQHTDQFDPDMLWLAVLESIADCMSKDGPMAQRSIGVSGDEEHRHVVREVLGSRGVAPTRVIATPVSTSPGAAECQGGTDCSKRVEITVDPHP